MTLLQTCDNTKPEIAWRDRSVSVLPGGPNRKQSTGDPKRTQFNGSLVIDRRAHDPKTTVRSGIRMRDCAVACLSCGTAVFLRRELFGCCSSPALLWWRHVGL